MPSKQKKYQEIKTIVIAALEADVGMRDSIIQEKCKGDLTLKAEVEALMAQDVGTVFMEDSPVELILPKEKAEQLVGKLGRITIKKLIARGGMGDVYEGVDDLLGRPVAIKIINRNVHHSESRREAFLNEAKILSNLAHPNICQVYDFFEDKERDVLVMELINGQTLRERLDDNISISDPLNTLKQIIRALTEAHERGVVHHDLKPENIMISHDQQVKILDFGLANEEQTSIHTNSDNKHTSISGTPAYMSPEQARGEQSTTSSDIWSFGLLMIELFVGKIWYPNNISNIETIELAKSARVLLPSNLPASEKQLLAKLLNPNPKLRPTARNTLERLNHIGARGKRRLIAASVGLLFLISAATAWKYTTDLQQERTLALTAEKQANEARGNAEKLVSFMLTDLHDGLVSVGRLNLLEATAREALDYYGVLKTEQMQASHGQATMAMLQIAEVLDRQGDKPAAIALVEKAINALKPLHIRNPNDELLKFRIAWLHHYLSDVYIVVGDFDKSLSNSSRGIELGKQLTLGFSPGTGPPGDPTPIDRWKVLFKSMYRNADANMRTAHAEKSVPILEEAVKLALAAFDVEPKLLSPLADIQFKRCDAYYELNLSELMLEPCLAMYELDSKDHLADPENYNRHHFFAVDHLVLSRVYLTLSKLEQGLKIAEEGEQHYNYLIKWDPNNTDTINDFISLLVTKGNILSKLNKNMQSREVYSKADKLLKSILKQNVETTFLNNQFAIAIYFDRMAEAQKVAVELLNKNFKRRVFTELCISSGIKECTDIKIPSLNQKE